MGGFLVAVAVAVGQGSIGETLQTRQLQEKQDTGQFRAAWNGRHTP
jgi:hypothetical protein